MSDDAVERDAYRRILLLSFQKESNKIEGIEGVFEREVDALGCFINGPLSLASLLDYLHVVQSDAILRDGVGLDVLVGNHRPPAGGPLIRRYLLDLLKAVNKSAEKPGAHLQPFHVHHDFENLHPFTDGNGRVGRALWLWQMKQRGGHLYNRALNLGFLHSWYYQSLDAGSIFTSRKRGVDNDGYYNS